MREDTFDEILHSIKLPIGQLLFDRCTYRVDASDFHKIRAGLRKELKGFEKFLVLTDGRNTVVGGVLFYGSYDIQVTIFSQYRGKHYMSLIHKNGILRSECYPEQKVSLEPDAITSFDDFQMKHHLLSCAGLKISNLRKVYEHIRFFSRCKEFCGIQDRTFEEFEEEFG